MTVVVWQVLLLAKVTDDLVVLLSKEPTIQKGRIRVEVSKVVFQVTEMDAPIAMRRKLLFIQRVEMPLQCRGCCLLARCWAIQL